MLPFIMDESVVGDAANPVGIDGSAPENPYGFENGDYVFVPDVRKAVEEKAEVIKAYISEARRAYR